MRASADRSQNTIESTSVATNSEQWQKKGNAFLREKNLLEAEQCYRSGILSDPLNAICYSNLGYVLVQMGRLADAESMLSHAVERNPADSDAHYLLGSLAQERVDNLRAIECYRAALRNSPELDICRRALCTLLVQIGEPCEARLVMDQGPTLSTDTVDNCLFKGNMHLAAAECEEAVACFQKARELDPLNISLLINLGAAQIGQRDVFSAVDTYRAVLELEPNNVMALSNVAEAYKLSGQLDLAVQSYRQALRVDPQNGYAHQNMLYVLSHIPNCLTVEYMAAARIYGEHVRKNASPYSDWLCSMSDLHERPIRVGFVSGDLRKHPVGYFLENVLAHIDDCKVTCVAYSNSVDEDGHSAHLKTLFSEWNRVATLNNADLARKIHADKIDVLLDLAGHTGHNRLSVFAWRPAPVQVSWLGYWASTGLSDIDYILVDSISVRQDEAKNYTEKLWFLPETRLCLAPPHTDSPLVTNALPALSKGHITFASFQTLSKIGDGTLLLWAQVLARLPMARLRLQSLPLAFGASVVEIKKRLVLAGIDLDRVDIFGGASRDKYLAAYGEVDVVLDTFPFPGGTTTAEALWMGVPTVTLTGKSLLERQGESLLRCVGLEDWVATSEQEYVELVVQKVADLHLLAQLRADLRATVLASPLFDGATFAENLEHAFEGMVKEWRETTPLL